MKMRHASKLSKNCTNPKQHNNGTEHYCRYAGGSSDFGSGRCRMFTRAACSSEHCACRRGPSCSHRTDNSRASDQPLTKRQISVLFLASLAQSLCNAESALWIELLVWLALFEAARLSIAHKTAICFTWLDETNGGKSYTKSAFNSSKLREGGTEPTGP